MSLIKIQNSNNSDQYFYIDKENANRLEVEFNLTENGKTWSKLGDVLYNYSIGKEVEMNWKISSDKFHFLRKLANEKNIKKFTKKN